MVLSTALFDQPAFKNNIVNGIVRENGIFEPFIYINEHFAKTGSGQTYGKLKKDAVFSGLNGRIE